MSQANPTTIRIGKREALAAAVITILVSVYGFLMGVPPIRISLFVLIPLAILYVVYEVLRGVIE